MIKAYIQCLINMYKRELEGIEKSITPQNAWQVRTRINSVSRNINDLEDLKSFIDKQERNTNVDSLERLVKIGQAVSNIKMDGCYCNIGKRVEKIMNDIDDGQVYNITTGETVGNIEDLSREEILEIMEEKSNE